MNSKCQRPKIFFFALISLYTLHSILYTPPVFAADETKEIIGTIDYNQPSWGEDINLKGSLTPSGDLQGGGDVGPQTNQVKFPNLAPLNNQFLEAIPNLLPQHILNNFQPPEEKEGLRGQIFHPVCKIDNSTDKVKPDAEQNPSGAAVIQIPSYWTKLVGLTKLLQATSVTGASSGVKFQVAPNNLQLTNDLNAPNPNCGQANGEAGNEALSVESSGYTFIDFSLFNAIADFLSGLFGKITANKDVMVTVRPAMYLPGGNEFAQQTSEGNGFLRSFCWGKLCPDKTSELQTAKYNEGGNSGEVNLAFRGVAGTKDGYDFLQESLYPSHLQSQIPRPLQQIPTLIPGGGTGMFKLLGNPTSPLLGNLLTQAANAYGVPPAVLAAVAWVEGGHMWKYTDDQLNQYTASGAEDPQNCQPNGCGARGPMQFVNNGIAQNCGDFTGTLMPDIWTPYANSVNDKTGENRTPKVCNIKDSVYAAANKLKGNSGTSTNNTQWTEEDVYQAIEGYFGRGGCRLIYDRLGNRSYCAFVWENYR